MLPTAALQEAWAERGTLRFETANTILGDTTIGAGSVINGGVFLLSSVPPGHIVRAPKAELTMRNNPDLPPASWMI